MPRCKLECQWRQGRRSGACEKGTGKTRHVLNGPVVGQRENQSRAIFFA